MGWARVKLQRKYLNNPKLTNLIKERFLLRLLRDDHQIKLLCFGNCKFQQCQYLDTINLNMYFIACVYVCVFFVRQQTFA